MIMMSGQTEEFKAYSLYKWQEKLLVVLPMV